MKNLKTALITGGSGYLGSHLAKSLKLSGWYVIVLDKKITLNKYVDLFIPGDVCDENILNYIFSSADVDVVFHLAGRIEVGLSSKEPSNFWMNNVAGTIKLIQYMELFNIRNIVYSSSAAVYRPSINKLTEQDEVTLDNSVYGATKLVSENIIKNSGINHIIFRYFNLAGADIDGEMGEDHDPETHLIPQILGNLNNFQIYGGNYKTEDGTCVRDYIHVSDVAEAHVLASNHLLNNKPSNILNLGTGRGFSVLQVVRLVNDYLNKDVRFSIQSRREGDPDRLVADATLAGKILTFNPKYDIVDIIQSANKWYERKYT
jgi:UDP-glucose 4-epimerase